MIVVWMPAKQCHSNISELFVKLLFYNLIVNNIKFILIMNSPIAVNIHVLDRFAVWNTHVNFQLR